MLRACVVVPAYESAGTVGAVVDDVSAAVGLPVVVVDDGSRDATSDVARARGAHVLRHEHNRGKGAALRTGLAWARAEAMDAMLTIDADGQHPAESAKAVLDGSADRRALVLGVRDLHAGNVPRKNRFGNEVSNFFLSRFTGRPLNDTQCGLRRYPVAETLSLALRAEGFAFEAEVLLRAIDAGLPLVEVPVAVVYPPEAARRTHFRDVADPARIVATVLATLLDLRMRRS